MAAVTSCENTPYTQFSGGFTSDQAGAREHYFLVVRLVAE